MNKQLIFYVIASLVILSGVAIAASSYGVVNVYFNVPSDTQFTIAFPTAWTARTINANTEATANLTAEYITFNFSGAAPQYWVEPWVNGSSGIGSQSAASNRPIMQLDPTGNVNISFRIKHNWSAWPPSGLALAFNATAATGNCYQTITNTPTNMTMTYQLIAQNVNYSRADCQINVSLWGNWTSGNAGQTDTQLLINATYPTS